MLVLTRKLNESIQIGEDVTVSVVFLSRGRVQLGIEAPPQVPITRIESGELNRIGQPTDAGPDDDLN